ncbi:MAG: bifunctional adenosylcobinamide kinase/adenosylcobinamide-phosphate guanylyltransferase [Actinomycetia bacterium]|nr:bifunctional adenosylcobinamide kinase/adenosylcobinamide-phosphate guanylyltransferase [Actinomycetes bacterium]
MALTVVVGGARSGKSTYAISRSDAVGGERVFLATAEARDDEMASRIARHKMERASEWQTIEEPIDLARVVSAIDDTTTVLVDCLTLWVSNMIEAGHSDTSILSTIERIRELLLARTGEAFVVSNEVGSGIVPFEPDVRRYRDVLGEVNALIASDPAECVLMIAGRPLHLDIS